jgi:hypothetical protein
MLKPTSIAMFVGIYMDIRPTSMAISLLGLLIPGTALFQVPQKIGWSVGNSPNATVTLPKFELKWGIPYTNGMGYIK